MGETVVVVPPEAKSIVDDPTAIFEMAKNLRNLPHASPERFEGFQALDSWLNREWQTLGSEIAGTPFSEGHVDRIREQEISPTTSITEVDGRSVINHPSTLTFVYRPQRGHETSVSFRSHDRPDGKRHRILTGVQASNQTTQVDKDGNRKITTEKLELLLYYEYKMDYHVEEDTRWPTIRP